MSESANGLPEYDNTEEMLCLADDSPAENGIVEFSEDARLKGESLVFCRRNAGFSGC